MVIQNATAADEGHNGSSQQSDKATASEFGPQLHAEKQRAPKAPFYYY
jgi:hypothetical protein